MIIRTLLILAAIAAPAFAQMGGRYSPPPPAPVPPKPVVIATPAPATPKPKPKPRRRPAPPVDATAVTPEAATPAPAVVTEPAPAPAPAPAPVPEKPAIKKPAAPPVVKQPPAPVRSASATAYTAKVKAAFAKRWADAVQPHMSEFQPGNVSVVFKLDAEGKVAAFSVTENTSNEAFAKFCEQFVRDTAFDPPPAKSLADGQFEVPFTFWIY